MDWMNGPLSLHIYIYLSINLLFQLCSNKYSPILDSEYFMLQIALRREKMGQTAPFWRFSAASYPDLEGTIPSNPLFTSTTNTRFNGNLEQSSGVRDCDFFTF